MQNPSPENPTTAPAPEPAKRSRFASYRWPMIVVALLGGHVGAMALAVNIAGRDGGNVVLPDYYARALAWDEMRAKAADSELLGWDVHVNTSPFVEADGQRSLRVAIQDKFHEPVNGASVTVRFWHRAEGKAVEAVLALDGESGVYKALVPMTKPGIWSCDLAAEIGELLYVDTREIEVFNAGDAVKSEPKTD